MNFNTHTYKHTDTHTHTTHAPKRHKPNFLVRYQNKEKKNKAKPVHNPINIIAMSSKHTIYMKYEAKHCKI